MAIRQNLLATAVYLQWLFYSVRRPVSTLCSEYMSLAVVEKSRHPYVHCRCLLAVVAGVLAPCSCLVLARAFHFHSSSSLAHSSYDSNLLREQGPLTAITLNPQCTCRFDRADNGVLGFFHTVAQLQVNSDWIRALSYKGNYAKWYRPHRPVLQ